MIVDTHCHLQDVQFDDDREVIVKNLKDDNIAGVFLVGTDLKSCKQALELAKKYDNLYAILGLYPEYADQYNDQFEDFLMQNLDNPKVVAVGEIGLDYHTPGFDKEFQIKVFKRQIEISDKFNLPLSIHTRDAFTDTLQVLKECKHLLHGGSIHCFSGSVEIAREFVKLGFSLGFGGVCTFKNAKNAVLTLQDIDTEKILIETDSPYLAPVPYRGKRNEPKYTNLVLEKIAEIKNIDKNILEKAVFENTKKVFSKFKN